jgi:hypothetical protein
MARMDEARTDEYRDHAAECLDSARSVADTKAKLELLALAKSYLDLADLAEGSANDYGVIARSRG